MSIFPAGRRWGGKEGEVCRERRVRVAGRKLAGSQTGWRRVAREVPQGSEGTAPSAYFPRCRQRIFMASSYPESPFPLTVAMQAARI